jgi:hypothetical protein
MKKTLIEQVLEDKAKQLFQGASKQLRRHAMGYRSDVAYTIRFTTEEAYRLFIMEAKAKDLGSCFSDDTSHWDEAVCDDMRWSINFSANNVKWYEGYPDVDKHTKLIALAEDWIQTDTHKEIKDGGTGHDAYRIGYIFTRIGEDSDDIEENAGGEYSWDWISVSRQIITDWS